jgi:membrane fusion protein (multidrug efflux system)
MMIHSLLKMENTVSNKNHSAFKTNLSDQSFKINYYCIYINPTIINMTRLTFICLSLLFLNACSNTKEQKAKAPSAPIAVDAMIIKAQPFSYDIEASGSILAQEFVELKPETNGRITKLNIVEGTEVKQNELLVKLNDDDLQAQLKKAQSQYEIAQRNLTRLTKLKDAEGLNQQEFDVAENQVNNLKADIDYTQALIRKTEVRAPFTGLIGLRNVSNGAFVSNLTVLATLQQVNQLKVDFVLPENQLSILKKGMEVKVSDPQSAKTFPARIIAIEPQINATTRNVKVRAQLQQYSNTFSPGAFVKVLINAEKRANAILVPTNSIIPETRNKKIAVIRNGKAQFAIVETGFRTESNAEITKGLMEGDTIALNGILYLRPDVSVSIKSLK